MNKREYLQKVADINDALYNVEKEMKEARFKLIIEDDPGKRAWFAYAQERFLHDRDELKEKLTILKIEGYSDSEQV